MSESHPRLSAQNKLLKKAEGPGQIMTRDSSVASERIVSDGESIPASDVSEPLGQRPHLDVQSPNPTSPGRQTATSINNWTGAALGSRSVLVRFPRLTRHIRRDRIKMQPN